MQEALTSGIQEELVKQEVVTQVVPDNDVLKDPANRDSASLSGSVI